MLDLSVYNFTIKIKGLEKGRLHFGAYISFGTTFFCHQGQQNVALIFSHGGADTTEATMSRL